MAGDAAQQGHGRSGGKIAVRNPAMELVARIRTDEFKAELALALPDHVRTERFVRVAVTALLYTPEIADADPTSIVAALLRCAQDGLLPDGHEAALVVYKGRAQYLPMVGGLRRVAADHGWSVRAAVVYEADEFDYRPADAWVDHRPPRPGTPRGARIAAYAVAVHRDGRRALEVLDAGRVEQIAAKAQTQKVWREWPDRMWEKTAAKAVVARLGLGELDERALRILAASDISPEEATAAVYGPPARRELVSGSEPDPSPVSEGEAAAWPQAAPAAEGGESADPQPEDAPPGEVAQAHAPDAPGVPGGGGEQAGGGPEGVTPAAGSSPDPGAAVVPEGLLAGQTLAEVAAKGAPGVAWLEWAAQSWGDDAFGSAVRSFVREQLPGREGNAR